MNLNERNESIKEFFNSKADEYDSVHLKMMENKKAITESLNDNITNILDLGAGTGLELIPLLEKFPNAKVTVIDRSEHMLENLKKREFSNEIKIICGDFFEVDFGNSYDAVISSAALHHFNEIDKQRLYGKIYESLREGGQFINSDRIVNTQAEQDSLMREYEVNPNLYPHMDTPLAIENERRILKEVGFKNIEIRNLDDERYKLITTIK